MLNIVGGTILILVFSIEGALHSGSRESIRLLAVDLAERDPLATFARSIVGGAPVALLSYLVIAAGTAGARATMPYAVGVFLALGPFEHVVVSMLHMLFGLIVGADLTLQHIAKVASIALAGNLIAGIGLVTLSHAASDGRRG